MTQSLTKAVLLTGAAARISQEVALFDMLRATNDPLKELPLTVSQDDTLVSGFSSGSLNVAAINACFINGSALDWDAYYKQQVLFPLKNNDVYKITGIPFDTSPLRATIQKFLDTMNCQKVGDLAFLSYVLTFSWRRLETLWACSQNDGQYYMNPTDLFMSSTAIPVLFPSQEIHPIPGHNIDFPDGKYADGGTGGTFKKFENYLGEYVKQNGPFETLYVISPMRQTAETEEEEILGFLQENKMDNKVIELVNQLENISMNTFMKFLKKLDEWIYNGKPMANKLFVCIPEMEKNFNILNFDDQEEQYDAVIEWVNKNPQKLAVPLKQFIEEHQDAIA